jgi:hypothetical protein
VYTFSALHSISYPLSQALLLGRICSALLFSNFVAEKIKLKIWHFNFFEINLAAQKISYFPYTYVLWPQMGYLL